MARTSLIAFVWLFTVGMPFLNAHGQAPTTAPVSVVKEIQLEDPHNGGSICYLDLDTGQTYAYRESTPEDFTASRRWILERGVDIMCETNPPASGFASYNAVVVPSKVSLDDITDYSAANAQLKAAAGPTAFNLNAVGQTLPKTFMVRTREGAVVVLEVLELTTQPGGLRLRYRVLPKPVLPEVPMGRGRRGGRMQIPQARPDTRGTVLAGPTTLTIPIDEGRRGSAPLPAGVASQQELTLQSQLARQVNSELIRLVKLQSQQVQVMADLFGATDPTVLEAQRRLMSMSQLLDLKAVNPPIDPQTALLQRRFELQKQIAAAEVAVNQQSQIWDQLQKELRRVQAAIDQIQAPRQP